jgi:hypothetical protein
MPQNASPNAKDCEPNDDEGNRRPPEYTDLSGGAALTHIHDQGKQTEDTVAEKRSELETKLLRNSRDLPI